MITNDPIAEAFRAWRAADEDSILAKSARDTAVLAWAAAGGTPAGADYQPVAEAVLAWSDSETANTAAFKVYADLRDAEPYRRPLK